MASTRTGSRNDDSQTAFTTTCGCDVLRKDRYRNFMSHRTQRQLRRRWTPWERRSARCARGLIEDALKLHEVQAADLVAVINREAPPFRPDLMVNGPFDWRFGALMPPYLIEALPPLPAQLQYRLVDRELVLIDIEAGLIVDVLSRALTVD